MLLLMVRGEAWEEEEYDDGKVYQVPLYTTDVNL
jgi:hypothetical protein